MSLRAYLIELVGTFLLVFFCAGAVCTAVQASQGAEGQAGQARFPVGPVGLVGIALAQGAALAVLLSLSTRVSQGCLNPAVTLALWVTRRFDFGRCFCLVVVQLIGAAFAGMLVVGLYDDTTLARSFAGTPHLRAFYPADPNTQEPGKHIDPGDWMQGSVAEVMLTFLLTLALLNSVLDPRRSERPWAPMLAGLALTAAVLVGYYLSGAALNPARWFGTAIVQPRVPGLGERVFRDHLPYWMGPIVGALLAGMIHAEWFRPDEKKG